MALRSPEFDSAARQLAPHLVNLPGKLIAIDGRDGSGKTTLGRFLSWYFNVTLIETDLFLKNGSELTYHTDQIEQLVSRRLLIPRPVIVEGITVLKLLRAISRAPDILVYVTNSQNPGSQSFHQMFSDYEAMFSPQSIAHISVQLAH